MLWIIEAIKKHKKFIITAHVNPEGDSLCSQLAMKAALLALGKEARIVNHDKVPEYYHFLPDVAGISNDAGAGYDFDAVIVLDCPNLARIGDVARLLNKDSIIINIDHHISNENFGSVNWVDKNASSAGEMVYRLLKEMRVGVTKEMALFVYIAILTDTGSFNYDNTSRLTHEIAGELIGYGVDPASVSENVYERRTMNEINLLAMVLSTLKVDTSGKVAWLKLTKDMLEKAAMDGAKSEGFINYARSIDGVKVAVLFKENLRDDKINVSFRAKSGADVNKIAMYFGGGGHVKASGCVVEGALSDVEKKVIAKVEEMI